MTAAASSYSWAEEEGGDLDACCIAIVLGRPIDEVVEAFHVDRSTERRLPFAAQWDLSDPDGFGNGTILIDALDGAVVCAEANGWVGVDEARARLLSAAGRYAAASWNVEADMSLVYACEGAVVRRLHPMSPRAQGALPEERGLPFGVPGRPIAASLVLVERLTGVRLTRAWLLDVEHPTYLRNPDA